MSDRLMAVTFWVEVPDVEAEPEKRLKAARIVVPGWPDFGFRADVVAVSDVDTSRPDLCPMCGAEETPEGRAGREGERT